MGRVGEWISELSGAGWEVTAQELDGDEAQIDKREEGARRPSAGKAGWKSTELGL